MPLYQFQCKSCGALHEEFSPVGTAEHPCHCGEKAEKILSRCQIICVPDATEKDATHYRKLHKFVADNREKFESGEYQIEGKAKHPSLAV